MSMSLAKLVALVVDENRFHRKITAGVLRSAGIRHLLSTGAFDEGLDFVRRLTPDFVLLEWLDEGRSALDFILEARAIEGTLPILMLSTRRRGEDIEAARLAGADAYLLKPVSVAVLSTKIASVIPRHGPDRRVADGGEARATGDEDVKAALRRARVAVVRQAALALRSGDPAGARAVKESSLALHSAAEEIGDAALALGAAELVRYLEMLGDRLDPQIVRTHVHALHQLAHLPIALAAERGDLAMSLRGMVDRNLKQSGAA